MLDEERKLLAYYENDDMYVKLERYGRVYCCSAYSWDGELDVSEEFSSRDKAQRLYDFIFDNYTHYVPGEELSDFIRDLLYDGRYSE